MFSGCGMTSKTPVSIFTTSGDRHRSSGKKRKHHESSTSSSPKAHKSEDDGRLKSDSSKTVMAQNGSKDPKLHRRICRYLSDNEDKQYIDIEEMSKKLHEKYEEYRRKKFRVFRSICEDAFERINAENSMDVGIEDHEAASDSNEVKGQSANKMMSELYESKPKGSNVAGSDKPDVEVDVSKTKPDTGKGTIANGGKSGKNKTTPPATSATSNDDSKVRRDAEDVGEVQVVDLINGDQSTADVKSAKELKVSKVKTVTKRNPKVRSEAMESNVTFGDVGGLNKTLIQVCKLMIHLKHPEVYLKVGVTPPRGFLLHGPPGCGKTLLANAIAGQLKLPLIKLAATEIVSGVSGESESRLRDLFDQAASTAPCILFIDEIDAITQRRDVAQKGMESRIVGQLLACMDSLSSMGGEKEGQVAVIGATNRPDSLDPALRRAGRFEREIAMGIPDENARLDILKVLTASMHLDPGFDLRKLSRLCPGFVGADLSSLCSEAAINAVNRIFTSADELPQLLEWLDKEEPLSDETLNRVVVGLPDFKAALRLVQPSAKREGFATVPDVTWDDVGALDHVREELELNILAPVNHPKATKALGMEAPTGILLCGPPGCGKTLLAKAVANQAGINFISVKGPELLNMYVGESERAVRQVFQRAKNSAPCVIFFDELDALCPRRSGSGSGGGDSTARVVNQLLTEMDGMESRRGVFVMAATNRVDIIDPAVLRPGRLQKILFVDLPSASDRVAILKAITKNGTKPKLASDVDLSTLAATDSNCRWFSGADMSALVTEASVAAFKEYLEMVRSGRTVGGGDIRVAARHFERAFAKVRPSVSEKDRKRYETMRQLYSTNADIPVADVINFRREPLTEETSRTKDECKEVDADDDKRHPDISKAVEEVMQENGDDMMEMSGNGHREVEADGSETNSLADAETKVEVEEEVIEAPAPDGEKEPSNDRQTKALDEELPNLGNVGISQMRFLPGMEVRVKDKISDQTKAGRGGIVRRVNPDSNSCLLRLLDNKEVCKVSLPDLEPFTPDIEEPCKLLVPNESVELLKMREYLENDEDNVLVEFPCGKISKVHLDQLCKVSVDEADGR